MKLTLVSDTHKEDITKLGIPEDTDVLIHAGDFSYNGTFKCLQDHLNALQTCPGTHKLFISGNHDFICQSLGYKEVARLANTYGVTYLQDTAIMIDGVKFYGSPWTPEFYAWAFMLKNGNEMAKKWLTIPRDVDVLITHGPPHGILDQLLNGQSCGCEELTRCFLDIKPKVHVFGHVHNGYGAIHIDNTTFINSSIMNEHYYPVNKIQTHILH